MSYYPHSHLKDKDKLVSGFSNYATKGELEQATGIYRFDLAAKKILQL